MTDFIEPEGPDETNRKPRSLARRLGWFFAIAAMSLIVVVVVAYALRGLLFIG